MSSPDVMGLLGRLQIPHTQNNSSLVTLDALMNVTLHTIGAIALLHQELRKRQESNVRGGLYEDRGEKILSDAKINVLNIFTNL